MLLESMWQQWKLSKAITLKLSIGTIHFGRMVAEKNLKGAMRVLKIMRTENKNRKRPNATSRHADADQSSQQIDALQLINPKDLEWLAWNWRGWNNLQTFNSRLNMVFGYFNHTYGLLPSPEQILHGIVLA